MPLGTISSIISISSFLGDTTKRIINATDGEVELSTEEKVEAQLQDEFREIDRAIEGVKDELAEFELLEIALGISSNASQIYDYTAGSIDGIEAPNREGVLLLQQATAIGRYVLSGSDGGVAVPTTDGGETTLLPANAASADTALTAVSTVIYALASHLDNVRRFDDGAFTAETSREAIRDAADFLESAAEGLRKSIQIDLGVIDENRADYTTGVRNVIDGEGFRETISLDITGTTPEVAETLYDQREFVQIDILRWSENTFSLGGTTSRRTNESSAVAKFDFDGDAEFTDSPIELLDEDGDIIPERVDEMIEVARGLIRERAGDAFIRGLGDGDQQDDDDLAPVFGEVEFDPIVGFADPFAQLSERMRELANGTDILGSAANNTTADDDDPNDSIALIDDPEEPGGDKIEVITGFGILDEGEVSDLRAGPSNDFVVSDPRSAEGASNSSPETGAPDRVLTFAGNDVVRAGLGDDTILGGPGNDLLAGQGGDDDVRGGDGSDTLRGDTLYEDNNDSRLGDDTLDGGAGYDIVSYEELDYDAFRDIVPDHDGQADGDDASAAAGLRLPFYVAVDDPASGLAGRRSYGPDGLAEGPGGNAAVESEFALVIDVPAEDDDGDSLRDVFGVNPVGRDVLVDVEEIGFSGGRTFIDTGSQLVRISDEERVRLGADVDNRIIDETGEDYLLIGLGGRDILEGGGGADSLWGGDGDDTLRGGEGDDFLRGGPGGDQMWGEGGNDTLVPDVGSGTDFVYGGSQDSDGADTVLLSGRFDPDRITSLFADGSFLDIEDDNGRRVIVDVEQIGFSGDAGNAPFLQAEGLALNDLTQDFEFPLLTPNAAESGRINGTSGADFILGGGDAVTGIESGAGDDVIYAADLIEGRLQSTGGQKDITAGDGDDYVAVAVAYPRDVDTDTGETSPSGTPQTTVNAGDGADEVEIGGGLVEARGGAGDDVLRVANAFGWLRGYGEAGDDVVIGGANFDVLRGGDGADLLIGRGARDNLFGGAGDDTIFGDDGPDVGVDLPSVPNNAGAGDDIRGGAGDDAIFAGAGDDTIRGEGGDDTIEGGAGIDTVIYPGDAYDYSFGVTFADGAAPGDGGPVVVEAITLSGGTQGLSAAEGTDTLTGVEILSFPTIDVSSGNLETVRLSDIDFAALDPADPRDAALLDQFAAGTANIARLPLPSDQGPILSIEQGPVEAVEGDILGINDDALTVMEFDVTRTGDVDTFASVNWRVVPGTAQATDFRGFEIPEGNLQFSSGETLETITFQIRGGIQAEADETFEVVLDPIVGRIDNDRATGIIRDDDEPVESDPIFDQITDGDDLILGTPEVNLLDGREGDDEIFGLGAGDRLIGGEGNDTLIGDSGVRAGTGGVGDDTLEGGAGTDLAVFSGVAGDYSIEVVTPAGPGASDPVEIIVDGPDGTDRLIGIEALRFLGDGPQSARTIDDIAALAGDTVLSIAPGEQMVTEGDSGQTTVDFEITRSGSRLVEDEVEIVVSDYGTASPGDVARGLGTAVFGFGQTSAMASIAIAGDIEVEGNESLTVSIASDPGYEIGTGDAALTIRDDDNGEVIIGTPDPDTLEGTGGDDTIRGLESDDDITGESVVNFTLPFGDDVIEGGPGDDMLDGYYGSDTVYGGLGDDTIEALAAEGQHDFAYGGPGNDVIRPNSFNGTLAKLTAEGGPGADTITASSGDDTLDGGSGDDVIEGKRGDDMIEGGDGNDTLDGGQGDDEIRGGEGDDDITGGSGIDLLFGDAGADTIRADAGATVDAGTGDDTVLLFGDGVTVTGGEGADDLRTASGFFDDAETGLSLDGGPGDDTLVSFSDTDDQLIGGAGANTITTYGGADTIRGGEGADSVIARDGDHDIATFDGDDDINASGAGSRVIDSGAGDDSVTGADGRDTILAGAGADTVEAGDGDDSVMAGDGNDEVEGGDGADTLEGGAGDDDMTGGAGDDEIEGGAGADRLLDGAGDDIIRGGAGDDTLRSNDGELGDLSRATPGNDVFDGGAGEDRLHVFGEREGFRILATEEGTILEDIDPSNGDDGRDLLIGIEEIRFFEEDGVRIDQLVSLPARPPVAQPLPQDQFVMAEDGFPGFGLDLPTSEAFGRFEIDDLLAGVVDPDPFDSVELVDIEGGPGLDVSLNERDGVVLFDPADNQSGTFTFTLTVTDVDTNIFPTTLANGVFEVEVTRSLEVLPVPDIPDTVSDRFTVKEGETLTGNLFVDNGLGPDSDADGDTFVVSELAQEDFAGGTLELSSGARLTVTADGDLDYDQNGAFADLDAGETATDTFLYRVRDETGIESSRARVEINIEGAEGGEAAPRVIAATPMNDELQGGPGDDVIEVGGGIDRAEGGGGSDTFQFLFAEDGEREVATITDFEPGTGPDADIVDLNGLGVLASFSVGNDVQMIVDTGGDLDTAVFLGVNDPAMIEIA